MCNSPYRVVDRRAMTRVIDVQCGHCWACLKNAENDLIGRALADLADAKSAWFITLTYDDRVLEFPDQAKYIQKRDLQNFFKRLRRGGHKLRYVAAGETGGRGTRRTHFHVIVLWLGMPPKVTKYWNGKDALDAWPWGHVDIDPSVNRSNLRYVVKYATKAKREREQNRRNPSNRKPIGNWLTYSRKPLLGHSFVVEFAKRYANEALMPRNLRYTPPGGNPKHHYSLFGKAEEVFLDHFFAAWPEAIRAPKTQWLQNATWRWLKLKQRIAWSQLSDGERWGAIYDQFRCKPVPPLTKSQKIAQDWERYDLSERARTWLDDLRAARVREVEELQRHVLSRYGFTPDVHPDPLIARRFLEELLTAQIPSP